MLSNGQYLAEPYIRIFGLRLSPYRVIRHYLCKRENWPRLLFKYKAYDQKHLKDIIVNSCLYMSSVDQINDPFDSQSNLHFDNSGTSRNNYLTSLIKNNKVPYREREKLRNRLQSPEIIQAELQKIRKNIVNNTGFFSFSAESKNLLLWSHYSNSHKGVCLIFDVAQDIDVFVQCLPIKYSKDYPEVKYSENLKGDLINATFLTKADDWAYENERRIFNTDRAHQKLAFSPKALYGIILGAKSDQNDIQLIKDLLVQREKIGGPKLKIFQSYISDSKYKVFYKQIRNF